MAKAKLTEKHNVRLTLTPAEARTLQSLVGLHVYGVGPVRAHTSAIYNALGKTGVECPEGLFTGSVVTA